MTAKSMRITTIREKSQTQGTGQLNEKMVKNIHLEKELNIREFSGLEKS